MKLTEDDCEGTFFIRSRTIDKTTRDPIWNTARPLVRENARAIVTHDVG